MTQMLPFSEGSTHRQSDKHTDPLRRTKHTVASEHRSRTEHESFMNIYTTTLPLGHIMLSVCECVCIRVWVCVGV